MNRQDQSRMGVQLTFRKGRPFVVAEDAKLSLSSLFCSGSKCMREASGSLAPSGPGLASILLKRLNLTLADIRYIDQIASEPLFTPIPRDRPEEPSDDATEEEKVRYRRDLDDYKRKMVEPPDLPADDDESKKAAYKLALEAFKKRKRGIDELTSALRQKIADIPATREARAYSGGWPDFFKDATDDAQDGPFEKWRSAMLKSDEVRNAFRAMWQAIDGEEHAFALNDRQTTLSHFYTRVPGEGSDSDDKSDPGEKSVASDLVNSPLIFLPQGSEPGIASYDLGQICFQISDPIKLGDGDEQKPNFSISPAEASDVVIRAMRQYGLEGMPWSPEAVRPAINSYYRERGYSVKLLTSPAREEPTPRTLEVLRQRISIIRLSRMSEDEAFRVLQTVLPAASFKELVRNDKGQNPSKYLTRVKTGPDEGDEQIVLKLRRESEPVGEDPKLLAAADEFLYIDSFKFDRIASALGDIHYRFADPQVGSDDTATHTMPLTLTVVKHDDEAAEGKKTLASPPPASGSATPPATEVPPGGGQAGAGEHPEATPSSAPSPSPTTSHGSPPPPEKERGGFDKFLSATLYQVCPRGNNFFYGGVLLRPRQGARSIGGYKCLKAGPGVAGLTAGEDGDAIGSLSYSAVIPFFGTGPYGQRRRPLTVAFEAMTTFERSRLINGSQFDERRKGGLLRFVLPLRPPAEKLQFDISAEARRQTVSLIQGANTVAKQNLTTLDLGARFYLDRRTAAQPNYWELTPRLKIGLGLADGERAFLLFSGTAAAHGGMGYAFDYDVKGRISVASRRTPLFERPSLGAQDTVRGFRSDDVIGLRLWAVQPELWLRGRALLSPSVNPLTGEESKLRNLFRESLSFAVFYDVGGAYRTVNSPSGVRSGPGFGLRFNYGQRANIKLDWAYGVGDRASGRSRFRFYFTLDLPENPL